MDRDLEESDLWDVGSDKAERGVGDSHGSGLTGANELSGASSSDEDQGTVGPLDDVEQFQPTFKSGGRAMGIHISDGDAEKNTHPMAMGLDHHEEYGGYRRGRSGLDSTAAMGTSMPIRIPAMPAEGRGDVRKRVANDAMPMPTTSARGAPLPDDSSEDDPGDSRIASHLTARMSSTFVPPHMISLRQEQFKTFMEGGKSFQDFGRKRDELKRRTAIMQATGFIEEGLAYPMKRVPSVGGDSGSLGLGSGSLVGSLDDGAKKRSSLTHTLSALHIGPSEKNGG
jgi:hypothetical protein